MPAAIKKGKVVACHVCTNKDVPVTVNDRLRRHTNARGFVCRASTTPRQHRVRKAVR